MALLAKRLGSPAISYDGGIPSGIFVESKNQQIIKNNQLPLIRGYDCTGSNPGHLQPWRFAVKAGGTTSGSRQPGLFEEAPDRSGVIPALPPSVLDLPVSYPKKRKCPPRRELRQLLTQVSPARTGDPH